MDEFGGSIGVGMRADLAVLDRDVFDTTQELPADAHVDYTIASGAIVYERWRVGVRYRRQLRSRPDPGCGALKSR